MKDINTPKTAGDLNRTCHLAIEHHKAGRLQIAAKLYQQIIAADPNNAEASHLLGVLMDQIGHPDMAVALISKAIEIDPNRSDFLDNLGIAYRALGRLDQAITVHQRAIAMDGTYAPAQYNLAAALHQAGRYADAIAQYRRVLSLGFQPVKTSANLGALLIECGSSEQAKAVLEGALEIAPADPGVLCNLGLAHKTLGAVDAAIACYERVIQVHPTYTQAHAVMSNLGNTLAQIGNFDRALACYQKALAHNADDDEARVNLAILYQQIGQPESAHPEFERALKGVPSTAIKYLCNMCYFAPDDGVDAILEQHRTHAHSGLHAQRIDNGPFKGLDRDRRLRIGYVSSDFRSHPVGHNIKALFEHRDPENFALYCYAETRTPDAMTAYFQDRATHWRSTLGLSDAAVAAELMADNIDILVVLAGHFDGNRLSLGAHRIAPIQVSYHDIVTSGLADLDYFVTDEILHPTDTRERFTETLYRLPIFYNRAPLTDGPAVSQLPCLKNGYITFGAFNNPAKTTPTAVAMWCDVLKSVPESRMRLKYKNWYANTCVKTHFNQLFERAGIPLSRVDYIETGSTASDYFKDYQNADIALDPFPFTGATTTFDALSMGVPVVTLAGETFRSRYSAAILTHAGLGDLIATSTSGYVAIATHLAGDPDRLSRLRAGMRDRVVRSPLCDGATYARSVALMYREMWHRYCDQGSKF
ncbi:MAG: tetratricopeptide repeat protein [Myxococcota bacterium]|nr:tetratricopeptide repeat protein [Myxococcota bacterium]